MNDIAIGPVHSRRFGKMLEVNLTPSNNKICSFDCPYCNLPRTNIRMKDLKTMPFPSLEQIDIQVRDRIRQIIESGDSIDIICVSGNGDPSLYPNLLEAFETLQKIRFDMVPDKKLIILSNGANLSEKKVVHAMNQFDERHIKVDGGNDIAIKNINQPLIKFNTESLQLGTRKLKDFIAQSVFVTGVFDNSKDEDVDDWMELISMLKPKSVQIMTINKPPADKNIQAIAIDKLHWIAQKFQRTHTIPISVVT